MNYMDNDRLASIIILTILVTAIIVGGGVYSWQNFRYLEEKDVWVEKTEQWKNQVSTLEATLTNSQQSVEPLVTLSSNLVDGVFYENSDYGFTIDLPRDWRDYRLSVYHTDTADVLCFYFSATSPVCLFQINVYTPAEWAQLMPRPTYLAENNLYVFAYEKPESCSELSDFQCARLGEVPVIASSFQFVDDSLSNK